MAKRWSGFKPQNEIILLQWVAMTISDPEVARRLANQLNEDVTDGNREQAEDESDFESDLPGSRQT